MVLERLGSTQVLTVSPSNTVSDAIALMRQNNIRHLPVVEESVPVGIVTDHDILFHINWEERTEPWFHHEGGEHMTPCVPVEQVMTTRIFSLSPEDRVEQAARLMVNNAIGAIPLTKNDRITGIVTETDFLRCFIDDEPLLVSDTTRQQPVGQFMTAHVFSVHPDDATMVAVRLMRKKRIRHLPVVDEDKLVGMISDRDVLRGSPPLKGGGASYESDVHAESLRQVRGIMTSAVETLESDATLSQAAEKMMHFKISAIPVVDNGHLVGIITETDLLRVLVTACESQVSP